MDCCICISFAISFGLVRMLLLRSIIQSNGGISKFLNTFLFIFLGLMSYNSLYLDMDFLMHSLVYLVVILFACVFVILANVASSLIHSFFSKSSCGGGGMLIWVWLFNSFIIGCIHQFIVLLVIYIAFLIRWYVLICFFHIFCSFFGKKSPYHDVLLVSVGMGIALHVFSIISDIFWIM